VKPLLGSQSKPRGGRIIILYNPLAVVVHPAQRILGTRAALISSSAVPNCGLEAVLSDTSAKVVSIRNAVLYAHVIWIQRNPALETFKPWSVSISI
jgi:hypothetical protein